MFHSLISTYLILKKGNMELLQLNELITEN